MPQLWNIGLEECPNIAPHSSPTCCTLQIHSPRCNIPQQCLPDLIAQYPILHILAHATETLQDPVIFWRPQCTIGKYIESLSSTLISPDRALFSDCVFISTSCIPIPVDIRWRAGYLHRALLAQHCAAYFAPRRVLVVWHLDCPLHAFGNSAASTAMVATRVVMIILIDPLGRNMQGWALSVASWTFLSVKSAVWIL